MKNLISKITMDNNYTGAEMVKTLSDKLECFPALINDIQAAIAILDNAAWVKLKRSRNYWNKIVDERIGANVTSV